MRKVQKAVIMKNTQIYFSEHYDSHAWFSVLIETLCKSFLVQMNQRYSESDHVMFWWHGWNNRPRDAAL